MLTIAVLDIYSFFHSVLHKYSFLRIKIPSVFHEKVRFLNILFIPSIHPCIKKIREIREIRVRPFRPVPCVSAVHKDSFNSCENYIPQAPRVKFVFKKIKFVFEKIKLVFKKIKIRVQKDKIRVPCTASPAIPVICVYVHAHTHAPACVYFIR